MPLIQQQVLWKPPYDFWQDRYAIVWVSVPEFDAAWKHQEPRFYMPAGQYGHFGLWLKRSNNPRRRVKMPIVGYPEGGTLGFQDGRHRWAWCRDHGATALPVMVYLSDFDAVTRDFGTSERKTVLAITLKRKSPGEPGLMS